MCAFGGALTQRTIGRAARGNYINYRQLDGNTLIANAGAGAFAIATGDSGRYTTDQTPPANETAFGATGTAWGQGEGNWLAGDEFSVMHTIDVADVAVIGMAVDHSAVSLVGKRVNGGNFEIDLFNRGATATGSITLALLYLTTLIQ